MSRSTSSRGLALAPALASTIALALVAMPSVARAAGLSLVDAVREALARNPAVAAARLNTKASRERTAEAKTAWLPRLELDGTYRYSGPLMALTIDTGITPPGATKPLSITRNLGSHHDAAADLKMGWRAFDFGARDARIDAARAMARASAAQGVERAAQIAYAVRAAYLSTRLFHEVVGVTQRARQTAADALRVENARQSSGLGSAVAVAASRSRLAELDAWLVDAHENERRSMQTLRLLLGWPADRAPEPTDPLERSIPSLPRSAAGAAPPKVVQLRAVSRAFTYEDEALARAFWPTLDLFGTFGYHYPRTFVETDTSGFVWAAGLALKWSLFDGDLRRRKRHEVQAESAATDKAREAAQEDSDRARLDAETRMRASVTAISSARQRLAAAKVYLHAAQGGLEAGLGTDLDVRQAENAVDGAHLGILQAHFEAAMAHAAWLEALGRTGVDQVIGDEAPTSKERER